jgi:hypothetical protein
LQFNKTGYGERDQHQEKKHEFEEMKGYGAWKK